MVGQGPEGCKQKGQRDRALLGSAALQAFRDIIVDIASETAKKGMGL